MRVVLLKVLFESLQSRSGIVRLGYGLAHLLNVPVRLRVRVQAHIKPAHNRL